MRKNWHVRASKRRKLSKARLIVSQHPSSFCSSCRTCDESCLHERATMFWDQLSASLSVCIFVPVNPLPTATSFFVALVFFLHGFWDCFFFVRGSMDLMIFSYCHTLNLSYMFYELLFEVVPLVMGYFKHWIIWSTTVCRNCRKFLKWPQTAENSLNDLIRWDLWGLYSAAVRSEIQHTFFSSSSFFSVDRKASIMVCFDISQGRQLSYSVIH